MMHDKARVEAIRARVNAHLELIKLLQSKIAKGNLPALEVARNQIKDVETLYLNDLDKKDRTAVEEAEWLSYAEAYLHASEPQLRQIEGQIKSFGDTPIQVVG
jgi:hypothetical protein